MGSNGSKVNGIALYNVGRSLSNVVSDASSIQSAANGIDASLVSSFSPGAVGGVENINSAVSTLIQDLNNLETSYCIADPHSSGLPLRGGSPLIILFMKGGKA